MRELSLKTSVIAVCAASTLLAGCLCDKAADAGVKWEVRPVNGVGTLLKNGKPVMVNMVYDEDSRNPTHTGMMASVYSKPGEADIHMHQLPLLLDWENVDDQRKTYDALAKRMDIIVKNDPEATILLRLLLWPSKDWAAKHQDELVRGEKGDIPTDYWPPVSMMSTLYYDSASRGIKALAQMIEAGAFRDRVMGYMPCIGVTGETGSFRTAKSDIADYAPAAQKGFRQYLLKKYGGLAEVNKALGTSFVSESAICIPSEREFTASKGFFLNPRTSALFSDYYTFNDSMLAQGCIDLCKAAKDASPGKIAGLWYAQVIQATWGARIHVQHGRYEWRRLAQSDYVDFVCTPAYYSFSGLDHPATMQGILDSINLYGKIFIFEYDRPTHLLCYLPMVTDTYYANVDGFRPVMSRDANGLPKTVGTQKDYMALREKFMKGLETDGKLGLWRNRSLDLGRDYRDFFVKAESEGASAMNFVSGSHRVPANMKETVANIRRWTTFCSARPTAGLWWWDQEGTRRAATGGLGFNHPQLMGELKKVNSLFEKAVSVDRKSRAEVAVFYDMKSCHYQIPKWGSYLKEAFVESHLTMDVSGVPCDEYFFDEIEDIPELSRYKMVVFLNSNYIPKERRDWIDSKLKRDGRVIVWQFGSGYLDENGMGVDKMEKATGIRFREEDASKEFVACKITDFKGSVTAGVPAAKAKFGCERDPMIYQVKPWFSVDDPAVSVFGVSLAQGRPVGAYKDMGGWKSVYVPTGPMPVEMIRNLASLAGVHVYTDAEDVNVWAAKSIIGVYSYPSAKGRRTICLPPDVKSCEEFYSGKTYPIKDGRIEIEVDGATAFCFFVK